MVRKRSLSITREPRSIAFCLLAAGALLVHAASADESTEQIPAGQTATPSAGPLVVYPDGDGKNSVAFWLATSLQRVFPNSPAGDRRTQQHDVIDLDTRGESFQRGDDDTRARGKAHQDDPAFRIRLPQPADTA